VLSLLRKKSRAATKQQIPITPIATAIPIPAFAPLLSPPFEVFDPLVPLEEEELDVTLAADPVVCVPPVAELVDELAKFQPLIWTPWITDPVPVMVIVVGSQDPSLELMGVMTWPLVKVEKHSFALGAAAMTF
jgi:hypothetical protein